MFVDTGIVPLVARIALAGIPMTPIERIAGAIVLCATDPDPETNGLPWLLPDEGPVYRLSREELVEGVYDMVNKRVLRAQRCRWLYFTSPHTAS